MPWPDIGHTMARLVSFVGLLLMLEACMTVRCQHAVLVGVMLSVTLVAADSPVAGKVTRFAD